MNTIKAFDTQAGVPNAAGVITAGSTVTFNSVDVENRERGTMFPRVKLNLNSAAGASIITLTGATALTTMLTKYTLTGTVPGERHDVSFRSILSVGGRESHRDHQRQQQSGVKSRRNSQRKLRFADHRSAADTTASDQQSFPASGA